MRKMANFRFFLTRQLSHKADAISCCFIFFSAAGHGKIKFYSYQLTDAGHITAEGKIISIGSSVDTGNVISKMGSLCYALF